MTRILLALTLGVTLLWCLPYFPPGAVLALAVFFYLTDRQNREVSAFCGAAMCVGSVTSVAHLMLS